MTAKELKTNPFERGAVVLTAVALGVASLLAIAARGSVNGWMLLVLVVMLLAKVDQARVSSVRRAMMIVGITILGLFGIVATTRAGSAALTRTSVMIRCDKLHNIGVYPVGDCLRSDKPWGQ